MRYAMKIKNLIFLFAILFSITSLRAQSANEKIGGILNKSDFFELDEQYPLLKNDIEPMLRFFSESLLAYSFNQPQKACVSVDSLLTNYQQEIGFDNVQSMFLLKAKSLAALDKYGQAADDLKGFMDAVSEHMDPIQLKTYQGQYEFYNKLRSIPKSELNRPAKDCVIPIEIDLIKGKSKLLFVPVTINGKKERFIFDTGCPMGAFVSERFAQEHNVKTIVDSLEISGTGTGYGRLGLIDSIEIGGMTYKNVKTIVAPSNQAVDTVYQVDAVLGLGLMMAAGELQIYPKENKIVFPFNETAIPATGRNMMFTSDQPHLKTYSNGERLIMHFDTGNSTSNLHYIYYEKHKEEIEKTGEKKTRRGGGFGAVKMIDVYRLPVFPIEVGDHETEMQDMDVNIEPFWAKQNTEDGALGMAFITLFDKVTINFNKMFVEVK